MLNKPWEIYYRQLLELLPPQPEELLKSKCWNWTHLSMWYRSFHRRAVSMHMLGNHIHICMCNRCFLGTWRLRIYRYFGYSSYKQPLFYHLHIYRPRRTGILFDRSFQRDIGTARCRLRTCQRHTNCCKWMELMSCKWAPHLFSDQNRLKLVQLNHNHTPT